MKIPRSAAASAALLVLGAACAAPGRTVRATGWAPEDASRPGTASRRAEVDALRRAVETVAGARLSGLTAVRRGVAVSDRVSAVVSGCVRSFRVLDDRPDRGGRRVSVRATVATEEAGCAAPSAELGASISVSVTGEGADAAASALRASLSRAGWAQARRPCLFVRARSRVRAADDPRLLPLSGARARVDLTVADASGRDWGAASGADASADADPAQARERALRRAGRRAGEAAGALLQRAYWSGACDENLSAVQAAEGESSNL